MTMLKIYSSKQCGACEQVVPILERLSSEHGVPFQIIDVDDCGKKCDYIEYVPHLEFNGKEISVEDFADIIRKKVEK